MANSDHLKILDGGSAAVSNWQETIQQHGLDLRDAPLSGRDFTGYRFWRADFTNANLSGANLSGVTFDDCNMTGANFTGATAPETAKRVTIQSCKLDGAIFCNAAFPNIKIGNVNANNINFANAYFRGARLSKVVFTNAQFDNAHLEYSAAENVTLIDGSMRAAKLAHVSMIYCTLDNVDLHGGVFREAHINGGQWTNLRELPRTINLETVRIESEPKYVGDCPRNWWERNCDWESLRKFGRMPLFGLSYTVLIFIPTYIFILAWYNAQVEKLRAWQGPGGEWLGQHLHALPMPSLSLTLLIATVLLAIASTLYTLFCPSRIQEFTRDVWCDQFNRSLLHYWPISWKHRRLRIVCFVCYVVGGTGAITVLLIKVAKAGVYIVEHTAL